MKLEEIMNFCFLLPGRINQFHEKNKQIVIFLQNFGGFGTKFKHELLLRDPFLKSVIQIPVLVSADDFQRRNFPSGDMRLV